MASPQRPAASTLEPTALAAFLVALVLGWCPLTALAAIALGITALVRIREGGGARTGKGLAVGAIALAAAILVGWGALLERLGADALDAMDAQATEAIDAGLGRPGAAEMRWERSLEPAADAAAAFTAQARDALGEVRDVAITNRAMQGLADRTVTVAFTATGAKAVGFGSATFATDSASLQPRLVLRSIELEVGDRRLRLPAAEGTQP